MLLTDPIPYREALDSRAVRSLLPTTGRTADFARVETAIKLRAMFSATVTSVELLQKGGNLPVAEPWASMPNTGHW